MLRKNLGVPQWCLLPERRYKEHHLVLNISVVSKEEGLLKAFLFVSWWRTDDTMGNGERTEVPRSFSGWLSDIITAGPSLLVFSLVPFPSHFLFREACLFLLFSSTPIPPASFVFRFAALSLSAPMGLRGQHGGISDQFFKPRVPRLYTSWETALGWVPARSQKPSRLLRSRGLILRLGVEIGMRVKSSREEN